MADLIASSWSEQDNNNTSNSPLGISGNYAPSTVAPTIRAIMGATKRFYNQINPTVTSTGTGAAYVITYVQNPTALSKGIRYAWFAHADNTGAATVNIGAIGAKQLLSAHGLPLTAGQIQANDFVEMIYNGTSFQLISEQKHQPLFMQNATIQGSGNNSPTLSLSANSTIRAQASSGISGGFNVTLRNANNAIVKSLIVPETGSMTFGGDVIWTAGNDGAGSGSDADLLDGQQGAWYQDLANSSGTLPNARLAGNYSFGALTLSGTATAEFMQIQTAGNDPTLRLRNSSGVQVGQFWHSKTDDNLYLRKYNATTGANEGYLGIYGTGVNDLKFNGSTVWHAGNDGSGSGLDAGLLEGQNGAYYRNLTNSTGTLPNARISGDYDGIGILKLTNRLEVTGSAPNIVLSDTTSGQYGCRMRVDASNIYFDSISDAGAYAEVFRFELDTKNGFANGSTILTAANHNHLSIGTTAATARSALGLGNLATSNFTDLQYTGSSSSNVNFPVGSIIAVSVGSGIPARNGTVIPTFHSDHNGFYVRQGHDYSSSTVVAGTWRSRGTVRRDDDTNYTIAQRV